MRRRQLRVTDDNSKGISFVRVMASVLKFTGCCSKKRYGGGGPTAGHTPSPVVFRSEPPRAPRQTFRACSKAQSLLADSHWHPHTRPSTSESTRPPCSRAQPLVGRHSALPAGRGGNRLGALPSLLLVEKENIVGVNRQADTPRLLPIRGRQGARHQHRSERHPGSRRDAIDRLPGRHTLPARSGARGGIEVVCL